MKGQIQVFTEGVIAIGRHPSCHLRFPADLTSVSRQHAEIVREGNQFRLVDHSTNGTFVNGKRATETLLKNGDVLAFSEVGPKVSFLAEIREGAPEMEAVPPAPPPSPKTAEPPRITPSPPPREAPPQRPSMESRPAPVEPPQVAPTVKISLIIQYGPTLRSFRELPVTIGRSPQCHFVLEHPALSAQQAQILYAQERYWVRDLTGLRSVQVNRQPVGEQAPLEINDELALGPKGPYFRFLGGGRLAEAPEPVAEDVAPPQRDDKKGPSSEDVEGKPRKGLLSWFRKS
ncbi:MAG TPA: FHA domain-containing protein [Candidatus Methylomirabilis sp.]|nr:FHA domain-containing protein [Candidatus Methylomirabilis sp.]